MYSTLYVKLIIYISIGYGIIFYEALVMELYFMKAYEYRTVGFYQQACIRINMPDLWEGGITQALLLMYVPGRHDRIKLKI